MGRAPTMPGIRVFTAFIGRVLTHPFALLEQLGQCKLLQRGTSGT
jgi:hypothetical protein